MWDKKSRSRTRLQSHAPFRKSAVVVSEDALSDCGVKNVEMGFANIDLCILLFYLGSDAVGSSCDHMHQADQFYTANKLVVDLDTTAEPAHIWGSFFRNWSGRLAALWSLLTERDHHSLVYVFFKSCCCWKLKLNSNGLTTNITFTEATLSVTNKNSLPYHITRSLL